MSPRKQRALDLYLRDRPGDLVRLSEIDHSIEPPAVNSDHYRIPQTLDEFQTEIAMQHSEYPDGMASERVIRSLAMYAGVYPIGDAREHFTIHRSLSTDVIHPTAQLEIAQRAARVRAIPDDWQEELSVRTPLVVSSSEVEGAVDLSFVEREGTSEYLGSLKVLEHATPTPLAYITGGNILLVNPQMVCPLACSYCVRIHTDPGEFGLVNFTPKETTEYLMEKFGTQGWNDIKMLKLITGAFKDYPTLRNYTAELLDEIRQATNGRFDPAHNEEQTMHLLTNLVQTTEELREMKSLGVGSLEHTIEIIDNERRRLHMRRSNPSVKTPGKGEQSFEEAMEGAARAVETYGPDKYGTTVILGMDDEATTMRGYDAMKEAGVTKSTGGLYVPNAYDEVRLQRTTFEQTMRLRRLAAGLFKLPAVFADCPED